jgi:hypothetical protein
MRPARNRTAWLGLVAALAVHVADEVLTGFLDVYNPTVRALRESIGWFPMPEFRFDVWLTGLVAVVIGLAMLTPLVDRGPRLIRAAAVVFAGLMVLNGAAHMAGTVAGRTVPTVRFERPMPGFWSSPILIAAAVHFLRSATRREKGTVSEQIGL